MLLKIWNGRIVVCTMIALLVSSYFIYLHYSVRNEAPSVGDFASVSISVLVSTAYITILLDLGFGSLSKDDKITPVRLAVCMGLMMVIGASLLNCLQTFDEVWTSEPPESGFLPKVFEWADKLIHD